MSVCVCVCVVEHGVPGSPCFSESPGFSHLLLQDCWPCRDQRLSVSGSDTEDSPRGWAGRRRGDCGHSVPWLLVAAGPGWQGGGQAGRWPAEWKIPHWPRSCQLHLSHWAQAALGPAHLSRVLVQCGFWPLPLFPGGSHTLGLEAVLTMAGARLSPQLSWPGLLLTVQL